MANKGSNLWKKSMCIPNDVQKVSTHPPTLHAITLPMKCTPQGTSHNTMASQKLKIHECTSERFSHMKAPCAPLRNLQG